MKGLERYLAVHGRHFTEQLACAVCDRKWSMPKIRRHTQSRVYYNVTGSTDGDMMYLMETFRYYLSDYTWHRGITLVTEWVGDYSKSGVPFSMWVSRHEDDFDLTPYI